MGIFGKILAKIFPADHPAVTSPVPPTTNQQAPGAGASTPPAGAAPTPGSPAATSAAPVPSVDVEAVLTRLAAANPGPANWKTSIVDLMKLLDLDSDLASRKALAQELGYGGDTGDSARMNVWLHQQVMAGLAANGGQVPASMRS